MCTCLIRLMNYKNIVNCLEKYHYFKKGVPSYNRNLKRQNIRARPTRMRFDLRITIAKFYLGQSVPQIMSVHLLQVKWSNYLTETTLTR